MNEKNHKSWFGQFLAIIPFLNPDILTRNQNIHLEKRHSEWRQKEIEREERLREKELAQKERNQLK